MKRKQPSLCVVDLFWYYFSHTRVLVSQKQFPGNTGRITSWNPGSCFPSIPQAHGHVSGHAHTHIHTHSLKLSHNASTLTFTNWHIHIHSRTLNIKLKYTHTPSHTPITHTFPPRHPYIHTRMLMYTHTHTLSHVSGQPLLMLNIAQWTLHQRYLLHEN